MIRVNLGKEVAPGLFGYSIPSLGVSGKSRQPLLSACRDIKEHAGLFRRGRTIPDLHCSVTVGANTTVAEPSGTTIHFAKFQKFDGAAIGRSDTTATATAEAGA